MAMTMAQSRDERMPSGGGGGGGVSRQNPPAALLMAAPSSQVATITTTTTLPSSPTTIASFWEPGGYKPNLRRINDSNHLCNDFIALVNERADIEARYASMLRKFSEKWNTLIDKGAEYGSMQSCWKSVLIACDRLAAVHATMHEEMLNEVVAGMKQWQKHNMVKQTLTRDLKFKREIEDEFKRAQKSWEKLLREVADTKADYFHCCQKEKSSIVRERNVARDQSVSVEQRHKYEDETHKLTENKQRAREKYARAVRELAYATPKYKDDMQRVFSKCQEREAARMEFFKQMFFKLHDCLDLSARPQMPEIFSEFYLQIDKGDAEADLRWWEKTWGPAMPMVWPTEFEEFRDDASKNIIGNNSSNNKIKLANIVPLQTSPLATPTKQPTQSFIAPAETAAVAHNGSDSITKTESLARQATALMNAVRVPGEPSVGGTAVLPGSTTSRPVTVPAANSGIALTSYQEHSEILPTVRYKPKQSRAQITAAAGRTLPWANGGGDGESNGSQTVAPNSQQYDCTDISASRNQNKMRSAFSEYHLNNVPANGNDEDLRARKPSQQQSAVGQRRSRGSVAENLSHQQHEPTAATNVNAGRRSSVIVLSKLEQQSKIQRGQTLPPATMAASSASSSFSSSSKNSEKQQRSATLYYNPQQINGETPPPTYDQPHHQARPSTSDENTTNDEENGVRSDNNKHRNSKNYANGRAHAVGAIGHAAGKRYAYVNEEDGPYKRGSGSGGGSASYDSSLERHFVAAATNTTGDIDTSTTTTEPYSNVIAEMHEKLNKSGRSAQRHRSNGNNTSQSSRKSRSRSRSRASRDHSKQQQHQQKQVRPPSSSSQDRATNTDKISTVNEKVQTSPPHNSSSLNEVDKNKQFFAAAGPSPAGTDFATSGNVRAKIKSFTSVTKITNDSVVSIAKPTVASNAGKHQQSVQKATIDRQQQHEPAVVVSPESGAASSIDSSEPTNNDARTDITPATASSAVSRGGGMKTFSGTARTNTLPASSANSASAAVVQQSNSEWESESADSALDDAAAAPHTGGSKNTDIICMVKAIYDYNAEEADEISLRLGEVLAKIQHEDAQGWCKGRKLDGREGLFPASFVVDE